MKIIIPKTMIDFKCLKCGNDEFKLSRSKDSKDRPIIKANCSNCNRFISLVSEQTAQAICNLYNTRLD